MVMFELEVSSFFFKYCTVELEIMPILKVFKLHWITKSID